MNRRAFLQTAAAVVVMVVGCGLAAASSAQSVQGNAFPLAGLDALGERFPINDQPPVPRRALRRQRLAINPG